MFRNQALLLLALGVVCICFAPPLQAEEKRQGIVVWRLEAKTGVAEKDVDSLSGYIASEVERGSGMKVISEADIATILKGEEKRQQCGAESSSCLAEIGAALGVPEAVAGDLGHVGKYWFLNLRRINVQRADVIKRASRSVEGDINDLIGTLHGAVGELFGTADATTQTPVLINDTNLYAMNPYKKYGYVTFFSGLGLCVFGGVAAWQAAAQGKDYEAGKLSAKKASDGWEGAMWASFAVGGAGMVSGIVLWALSPGDKEWAEKHAVTLAPITDGKNTGALLSFSW